MARNGRPDRITATLFALTMILAALAWLLSGCQTIAGAAGGLIRDVQAAGEFIHETTRQE